MMIRKSVVFNNPWRNILQNSLFYSEIYWKYVYSIPKFKKQLSQIIIGTNMNQNVSYNIKYLLATRNSRRFAPFFLGEAPILYLNCEHVLFAYLLKQRRKKFRGFKKKLADF